MYIVRNSKFPWTYRKIYNVQILKVLHTVLQQSDKFQVDWFDRPGNTAIYDFFFLLEN